MNDSTPTPARPLGDRVEQIEQLERRIAEAERLISDHLANCPVWEARKGEAGE